ncbi:MAG: hypothetical protein ACYCPH_01740 [Minisyncoccota bacterium]
MLIARIFVFVVALGACGLLCFVLRVPASTKKHRTNRFFLEVGTVLVLVFAGIFLCFSPVTPSQIGFAPADIGLQGLQEGEGYTVVHSMMTYPGEWVVLLRSNDINQAGEHDYIVRRTDVPLPRNFNMHDGEPQAFIKAPAYP